MSSSLFHVEQHVLPGQYVRGYPNGLKSDKGGTVRLVVKHYTPREPFSGKKVSILATHGNGFPKEMYEPLWDDLLVALRSKGVGVSGIWIADCAHQGASGVLNERVVGDDVSWFDHSLDLLHMLNTFRDQIPTPIIGIGHSMGCAQLVHLSTLHPRLLSSLILVEPVIQRAAPAGPNSALMATLRPDLWPSRAAAESSFRQNRIFQAWDPRVLEQFLAHALRSTPTALHPDAPAGSVTLTTTKHQEAWSYVRSNFEPRGNLTVDRLLEPDLCLEPEGELLSARAECVLALNELAHLRPSVYWMFGKRSSINTPALTKDKLELTGSGMGGSGGTKAGRVGHLVVDKASHFLPCERTGFVADAMAAWLAQTALPLCERDERFYREYGSKRSTADMTRVSREWKDMVKKPTNELRPVGPGAKL